MPDDVIVLKDNDNGDFLLKRYYNINRKEIDLTIKTRKEEEERKKREAEEERK